VETDPVVYVRTGMVVSIAVGLRTVVCLHMIVSWSQSWDASRAGKDFVQLSIGTGTARDTVVSLWLGRISPSQNG
jgi:hypothetical protein